jgi:hypothetical protein
MAVKMPSFIALFPIPVAVVRASFAKRIGAEQGRANINQ